jgi:hypothetical protein
MDDRSKTAFAFAQDTTKQLITLATGIMALTITFFHDFATSASALSKTLMAASWVLYVLSIIFGLVALMAMTGSLQPAKADDSPPSIRGSNVTTPAILQILLFLLALAVTVLAGILALL